MHTWHTVGAPGAYLLEGIDGATRITLRHTGVAARQASKGICRGWESSFERLEEYLARVGPAASERKDLADR